MNDVAEKEEEALAGDAVHAAAAAGGVDGQGQSAASGLQSQWQQQHQTQQQQQQDGQHLGRPIMQDVWSEAVECLQHNGGDVQVSPQGGLLLLLSPC
jgi:hypothetical protein